MHLVNAIVKAQWLRSQLMTRGKNVLVLHIARELDGQAIPDSRHFNIDMCKDENTPYKQMLPSPQQFAKYVSSLGITNDNHVVLYDHNEDTGVHWAPRIWWMFRVFGHSAVSVLEGGLTRWSFEGYPTVAARKIPEQIPDSNGSFKTTLQPDLVKDFDFMMENIEKPAEERHQMIDARSDIRFRGLGDECEEDLLQGHIRHAVNLPFTELVEDSKLFKNPYALRSLFNAKGIDVNRPTVAYCGIGVTACFVALAAKSVGIKNMSVYDGSWCEFGQRVQKVPSYEKYIARDCD